MREPVDLLIVGGGINGAGIARDAAGRGLKVLLCEKDDLASATSSASSKLIHGGLRYLERYEFRLVREALSEREVLLRAAPHIIWPLRFVLPHDAALRPAWMVRAGLFLYDHLGGRELLPGSASIDLRRDPAGAPLKEALRKGFCYSDCWVQDSRLVVLNAMDARERGAEIRTRTICTGARRVDGQWEVSLESASPETGGDTARTVRARALVNAAGPWVDRLLNRVAGPTRKSGVRLVKGSHMVVPRLHEGPQAYILQNDDRRVVFVLPYEERFSLIGTTDIPFEGDPADARITAEETDYLCAAVGRYFARPPRPEDAVWSYAGVRPLYDDAELDASSVTRDYVFDIDGRPGEAPLLSVFGGKITTYRKLAEQAVEKLQRLLGGTARPWTHDAPLPGGEIENADFEGFLGRQLEVYPWLPVDLARRYARGYGTRMDRLLKGTTKLADLGEDLGGGLREAEVEYLAKFEFARTAEDILWRRSKIGLHMEPETPGRVGAHLNGLGLDAGVKEAGARAVKA